MEASMTQLNRGKYKNKNAIENEIRYISRTRKNETRQDELIIYGTNHGYNYQKPVEEIIHELKRVQTMYGSRGSKLAHYCTKIYPKLFEKIHGDITLLADYAVNCCQYIYNLGYQCCFAIHCSKDEGVHIHLVISTTNFNTTYKLQQYPKRSYNNIEKPLLNMLNEYTRPYMTFSEVF